MEPMLLNVSTTRRNEPRDLQSRLYREIGISAVAAALQVTDATAPGRSEKRERMVPRAA